MEIEEIAFNLVIAETDDCILKTSKYTHMLSFMFYRADVNARSTLGWTAMSLAMHEAQSTCIVPLLEHGAEPKFGNFRGVETLNQRWQQIYRAAGFRLPRHSSTPDPDTCTPSLTVLCKFFVRRHLQVRYVITNDEKWRVRDFYFRVTVTILRTYSILCQDLM